MTHNLAALPKDQQNAIQRDLKAALWAHQVKTRKTTKQRIVRRIWALREPEKVQDMMQRFEKYMNTNPAKRNANTWNTGDPDWAPNNSQRRQQVAASPDRGHRPRMERRQAG